MDIDKVIDRLLKQADTSVMASRRLMVAMCVVLLFLGFNVASAQVKVVGEIDDREILIGQQTDMTNSVSATDSSIVEIWKGEKDEPLMPGVEILNTTDIQKHAKGDGLAEYVRRYRLTSFDDTLYLLPPISVFVDGAEYFTNELALKVHAVDIDTTITVPAFSAADVQNNPFLFSEWKSPFYFSVLMIILIIPVVYLVICLRGNKPVIKKIKIIKKVLPHQKAMKAIEEIKAERMSASENQKEYYTRLTDALRQYIHERYGFSAMEMTTDEIIQHLSASQDTEAIEELRTLFVTADLVKFAKYSTLINENDLNLVNAINFINSTKLENQPTTETIVPVMTTEEAGRHKRRTWLILAIASLTMLSIALLAYIVYEMVMLQI